MAAIVPGRVTALTMVLVIQSQGSAHVDQGTLAISVRKHVTRASMGTTVTSGAPVWHPMWKVAVILSQGAVYVNLALEV